MKDLIVVDDPVQTRTPEEQRRFEAFARMYWDGYYFPHVVEPAARRRLIGHAQRYDVGGCE